MIKWPPLQRGHFFYLMAVSMNIQLIIHSLNSIILNIIVDR